MENWFLADRETLRTYFGQGYRDAALPAPTRNIETVPKDSSIDALKTATKDCKAKIRYGKGEHSFAILGRIDPAKVTAASPWAARFVTAVKTAMTAP